MRGTRSVGITLLFWLAGALYTVAGTHLSIEFGLNTPRYDFERVEQGIPRSGGTLNYVCSHPIPDSNLEFANSSSFNMFMHGLRIVPDPGLSSS